LTFIGNPPFDFYNHYNDLEIKQPVQKRGFTLSDRRNDILKDSAIAEESWPIQLNRFDILTFLIPGNRESLHSPPRSTIPQKNLKKYAPFRVRGAP